MFEYLTGTKKILNCHATSSYKNLLATRKLRRTGKYSDWDGQINGVHLWFSIMCVMGNLIWVVDIAPLIVHAESLPPVILHFPHGHLIIALHCITF